jgi:hypothetical protein
LTSHPVRTCQTRVNRPLNGRVKPQNQRIRTFRKRRSKSLAKFINLFGRKLPLFRKIEGELDAAANRVECNSDCGCVQVAPGFRHSKSPSRSFESNNCAIVVETFPDGDFLVRLQSGAVSIRMRVPPAQVEFLFPHEPASQATA